MIVMATIIQSFIMTEALIKVKFGIKRLMEDLDSGQGGEEEFE